VPLRKEHINQPRRRLEVWAEGGQATPRPRGVGNVRRPRRVRSTTPGPITGVSPPAFIEPDPYGNLLGQGHGFLSARDWARLGNLYLQDGVWNGERLLPEGYAAHVRTVAPAWEADGRPVYGGGFFWVNGDGALPIPRDAFAMRGAGGQSATIIPSHGLVVVRIGKYRGAGGGVALNRAFAMLLEIVPEKR
jgi:CubicO group peptidase (beta-lactamase class C family)